MLIPVVLALAVLAGVPWVAIAVIAAALVQPWIVVAAVAAWVIVDRRRRNREGTSPDDEAAVLHALAAELAAGASLRSALASAVDRAPRPGLTRAARLAAAGMPASRVASSLEEALPVNGRLAGAAWLLASRSGGPAASLARSLALRAAEEGDLRRERRVLTAQARASAWVVVALPVALLGLMASTGPVSLTDPALLPLLAVGIGLQAGGVAVVVSMLRRSDR